MPPPSQLSIATGAVLRLLKEEISYQKELVDQEAQVKILEEKIKNNQTTEDGNEEFMLKQQKMALDQTKAVFQPLKERIADAVARLEEQIATSEGAGVPESELEQAKTVLAQATAEKVVAV